MEKKWTFDIIYKSMIWILNLKENPRVYKTSYVYYVFEVLDSIL